MSNPLNTNSALFGYNQPKIVYAVIERCTFWRLVIYHILLPLRNRVRECFLFLVFLFFCFLTSKREINYGDRTHYLFFIQYEDLEALSQTAREVWLAEQCSAFETEIQNLSREREKDHFIEELYRKLKQVTRRWQSWNHRSFGGVTSRG